MTTISKTSKVVTLINVFTVEPVNQPQLLELLDRATETSVRHARGFISSSLHRSLGQALAIAKFDPGMYEVVATYSAPAESA